MATTPLSGKNTWSNELSGSIRTCERSQSIYSSFGRSRLRSREERAIRSRFWGQCDGAVIRSKTMPVFVGCEWNFDNLIDLHAHLLALADAAIAWLNGFDKRSISAA